VDLTILHPSAGLLVCAVVLDAILGDPSFRWHPIRLMGRSLSWIEEQLRSAGADGRIGGCLLFVVLATGWAGSVTLLAIAIGALSQVAALAFHTFVLYSMIALRDLFKHGSAVNVAASQDNLPAARRAISQLVGRDTEPMDAVACRRVAIESLSENLVDGFVSPIFWYVLLGLPGIILFKVVSTMDSMVGYKTPRYFHFGWCGARLDDAMNLIPARLTWLLIGVAAGFVPGCSGLKAWRIGWQQHHVVPGPNAGWSEAATAGALQRRLIGPIWSKGRLVTDVWLGSASDPEGGAAQDYQRASWLVLFTAVLFVGLTLALMLL
jgi:adenosylcobinamide-phosphate synthase